MARNSLTTVVAASCATMFFSGCGEETTDPPSPVLRVAQVYGALSGDLSLPFSASRSGGE